MGPGGGKCPPRPPWLHPCGGHSTSISACGIWGLGASVVVQVFRREFYTHIHLDYATRVKFLSCINQKKKKIPTSTTILYGNRARPFPNSPKVANSLTRHLSISFYSFLRKIFKPIFVVDFCYYWHILWFCNTTKLEILGGVWVIRLLT